MSDPRIYADFNGLQGSPRTPARLAVPLDTLGTLRDLTNAGIRLCGGERLVIYDWSDDEEDLEAVATAYYDVNARVWIAELDEAGYAYVPRQDRTPDTRFLCVRCRGDWGAEGLQSVGSEAKCKYCGTPKNASIAPP